MMLHVDQRSALTALIEPIDSDLNLCIVEFQQS